MLRVKKKKRTISTPYGKSPLNSCLVREQQDTSAVRKQLVESVHVSWKHLIEETLDSLPELLQNYCHLLASNKVGSSPPNQCVQQTIYPPLPNVMRAFALTTCEPSRNPILCSFQDVKVVILGQDPYHGEGQAMGLSFSVPEGTKLPPSLRRIFKAVGMTERVNGDLTDWANQGVLLLNLVLGWHKFTDAIISRLSKDHEKGMVFMLWGKVAQAKEPLIDAGKHMILKTAHPSPLAASRKDEFMASKQFDECNNFLANNNSRTISWRPLETQQRLPQTE